MKLTTFVAALAGGCLATSAMAQSDALAQIAELRAQLAAWDKVTSAKSAENALFKKIMDSQRAFAQRAGGWQNDYLSDFKMAWNHYFRAPAKKA